MLINEHYRMLLEIELTEAIRCEIIVCLLINRYNGVLTELHSIHPIVRL